MQFIMVFISVEIAGSARIRDIQRPTKNRSSIIIVAVGSLINAMKISGNENTKKNTKTEKND